MTGWIKAYRSWLSDPTIWKSPDHAAVWLYLQLSATHAEIPKLFGKNRIVLKPGQLITGRKKVSEVTGVNESKVRRVLSDLQNDHLIDQQVTSKGRLICLLNWDSEQKSDRQSDRQSDQQVTTNKNIKKYKNSLSERGEAQNADAGIEGKTQTDYRYKTTEELLSSMWGSGDDRQ